MKLTHVKWVTSNDPVIILNGSDKRLYLSKRELKELRDEITEFMNYYADGFKEPDIGWTNIECSEDGPNHNGES